MLRISSFHALPAGLLSFAGPKESNQRKGPLVVYPLHSTAKNPIQSAALPNQVAEAAP
jgi:hypothetical protein